ncbi:hypothetical protein L596_027996 [Steinernema carpocapsae]|uniref:Uncharacterized protein n=1 Tax=Steinernema carpocapsae TaxID=34508 RepID=A0A4U5LX53_STECR|nr:hypothetical protein L596_027996 [Steinernema carpocapsae]
MHLHFVERTLHESAKVDDFRKVLLSLSTLLLNGPELFESSFCSLQKRKLQTTIKTSFPMHKEHFRASGHRPLFLAPNKAIIEHKFSSSCVFIAAFLRAWKGPRRDADRLH